MIRSRVPAAFACLLLAACTTQSAQRAAVVTSNDVPIPISAASVQSTSPVPVPLDSRRPIRWSLFDIRRGDTTVASIAGSMHAGLALRGPLPDSLSASIRESDLLLLEANRNNSIERQRASAELRKAMNGRSAADMVGRATWDRYGTLLRTRLNTTTARVGADQQHPALLVMSGLLAGCTGQVLAVQHVIWDDVLASLAILHGKPIEYIETIDEQLRHAVDVPDEDWPRIFGGALDYVERRDCAAVEREFTTAVAQALLAGEVDEIRRMSLDYFTNTVATLPLMNRMVFGRDAELAARIDRRIRAGVRPFVVLGAAHLGGDDGVLARLRAAGYTVLQR